MVNKPNKNLASRFTEAMATWKFVFITLIFCVTELWWNATTLTPDTWKFDKTMLALNTALSLWAAIQGSIIMIDARLADKKRDQLLTHINTIVSRLDKLEKERAKDANKR